MINEKESLLYDFAYKKRRRLVGEEQLVLDYVETLLGLLQQEGEKPMEVEIKLMPNHLNKIEIKKLLAS